MLRKHLLSDWRIDLPFSPITSACLFSLQTGYVLALEAQLVSKDNEMTPKSPTCFYSRGWDLRQTALAWISSDVLPSASQGLSQSCFPWIGTYWGHLALPPRRDGTHYPCNFSYLFFCIDSCVMLGCHDNWLISIQFLDWETRSHKELQMMPDCLLPIAWLLPFSGR